jgi:heptosyltransferase-2
MRWDRPCTPHKLRGKVCSTCDEYDPVRSRILLVKLAAVGDVLRTTALLPAIHHRWPGAHVTWLTAPDAKEVLVGNNLVDDLLTSGDAFTAARLQQEDYDVVLCPDADPEAATFAGVARAGERHGFHRGRDGRIVASGEAAQHWLRMGLWDPMKKANKETYQALVARSLDVDPGRVGEPSLELDPDDSSAAEAFRGGLDFAGPLVGLNTGGGGRWRHKQWTLDHQQSFLRTATAAGRGVLLLGGLAELERHQALMAGALGLPVFDSGNHNSIKRFAALMQLCSVVVTGDTLAVHVACARKVPVVVLFGPTSADEIELYGRGEKIQPEGLDCLVCYLPDCDVKPHCQARITAEMAWFAVERVTG